MIVSRVNELEQELQAKERCIQVLMERLHARQQSQVPFSLLEQNAALLETVAQKTVQLERRNAELDRARQSLQETQQKLLQSSKLEAIGRLAAGVAHEINTPIQFLGDNLSFLQESFGSLLQIVERLLKTAAGHPALAARLTGLLQEMDYDYLKEETPPALEATFRGLERVVHIVQAMRRFSHSSRGEKRPMRLEDIVATTLTVSACEYKAVATIETDFDSQLPPIPCLCDELSQVVLNLLVNAAYAIRQKGDGPGLIRITTRRLENMARLSISDNGNGMSEETQNKIFEPFFTTKPIGEGTGQGLAIAYRVVVEKHHGAISFESHPGAGTTFHIDLPLP